MDAALHIDPQDIAINADASVVVAGSTYKAVASLLSGTADVLQIAKNYGCVNAGCAGSSTNGSCSNYGCG